MSIANLDPGMAAVPVPLPDLVAGDLRLALRPDLGGSIAGLWHRATPVLRSSQAATLASARVSACYPLLPYSNRIGQRHFSWHGVAYRTAANFDDNPHSVHGVAWQRPWQVRAASADAVEIGLRHLPDEHWPFAFEASQRFVLTPQALRVELACTNTDARAQPMGLGWHPYFARRPGVRLAIEVEQRWDNDASGLAQLRQPQPGIDAAVDALAFDNGFDGWRGAALIDDEQLRLRLCSSLQRLVVFTPATRPYFCVEPVSHVSNAVQMADPLAHGLLDLASGATATAWMTLAVASA